MTTLTEAARAVEAFAGDSLRQRIAEVEDALQGTGGEQCGLLAAQHSISAELLSSAFVLERTAAQISVILHTVGILVSLPHILREGETIESLSLGAGNTGREFDVKTNERVAEFKFIDWQGGSESIRQNSLFKDFYLLAEAATTKDRYLYVIDPTRPMRFLNGHRAIRSVLSHQNRLWTVFQERYGTRFSQVCEYYMHRKTDVKVVGLAELIPELWAEHGSWRVTSLADER